MIILRNILYLSIFIFIALVFFENDSFFMKNLDLKINLRGWVINFPQLKIITLLILFFCLGYFTCYYRNIKRNFQKNKELKDLKKPDKTPEPEVEKIEESKTTNAEEDKET